MKVRAASATWTASAPRIRNPCRKLHCPVSQGSVYLRHLKAWNLEKEPNRIETGSTAGGHPGDGSGHLCETQDCWSNQRRLVTERASRLKDRLIQTFASTTTG